MIDFESFPLGTLRKQAKAKLEAPKAPFNQKTVLITGANGGFGSLVAKTITDLEVETLILAVRDVTKGEALREQLIQGREAKPNILVWQLDLASFDSVQSFGKLCDGLPRLDNTIMNAGQICLKREETADGWESSFQVNHLSSALLTALVLPVMQRTAAKYNSTPVMTFVCSWSIRPASREVKPLSKGSMLEKANMTTPFSQRNHQYGIGKIFITSFGQELASRLTNTTGREGNTGAVVINFVDPGTAATGITKEVMAGGINKYIFKYTQRDVETCSWAIVNASQQKESSHGRLLVDYDLAKWPKYMESKKGIKMRKQIWDETRITLEKVAPQVKAMFASLDAK